MGVYEEQIEPIKIASLVEYVARKVLQGGWGKPDFDQVIVTFVSSLRDEVFHTSFIVLKLRVHKVRKLGKRKFARKFLGNETDNL